MLPTDRRLVLVHGLWDDPLIFNRLVNYLYLKKNLSIFIPHLQHDGGRVPLTVLAEELDRQILKRYGSNTNVEILGFSMGGVISRIWLQLIGGVLRTTSFISVGSPHCGTFSAQLIPSILFPGIADMKRGSHLLSMLNENSDALIGVKCSSYFCRWDLMALPGWEAVLPIGTNYSVPVLTHKGLISNPKSLKILSNAILRA